MEILPKQKDVQTEILNKMDDKTLINFCHTNSATLNFCNNNQQFWLNRIISKFNIPLDVLNKYKGNRTWSEYYINDLRKISNDPQKFFSYGADNRMDYIIGALNTSADINFQEQNGSIVLISAASKNYFDIVKYLIEHGADPNIKNRWGYVALTYTIVNSDLNMFKYLIEHGAKPDLLSEQFKPLLSLPSYKKFNDYLETLKK